jgi:L-threonylcarbamoyladenylate synthase
VYKNNCSTRRLALDAGQPFNPSIVSEVLANDGVIAFVTDTVWGLGCLPSSEKAVRKIYEIKKREAQKPLILMSNDIYPLLKHVQSEVNPIPKLGQILIKKHFPGALTLVLKKSRLTPDYVTSGLGTVGIRVPDNETFRQICEIAPGNVLATTSANLSNQPSAKTYEQALENMQGLADLIIPDYGHLAQGAESTVAGVFGDEIKIFRQGTVEI